MKKTEGGGVFERGGKKYLHSRSLVRKIFGKKEELIKKGSAKRA